VASLTIFGSVVFGAIGMGYVWSGRRRGKPVTIGAGVGLCVFSYLVFINAPVFVGLGILLAIMPFVIRN
jgi:hypothetical protein